MWTESEFGAHLPLVSQSASLWSTIATLVESRVSQTSRAPGQSNGVAVSNRGLDRPQPRTCVDSVHVEELRDLAREWAVASATAQGLPPKVEDPLVLRQVAQLLRMGPRACRPPGRRPHAIRGERLRPC